MSAQPILLRPPGTGLSRRIAAVLATLFAAVLALTWLAVPQPRETPAHVPAAPVLAANRLPEPAAAPPRSGAMPPRPPTVLRFHPDPAAVGLDAASLLDASGQSEVDAWGQLLATHPDTRIMVTLQAARASDPLRQQRIGAALIRLLAGSEGNPHRIQLILAEPADAANQPLNPGDFQLTIETPPS